MTAGAVLALSPRGWAHVALALANHSMALEDRGEILPPNVRRLLNTAAELAKAGPNPGKNPARDGQSLGAGGMVCDAGLIDGERLISLTEVARYTSVSERTIRRRIASGELESVKLRGRRVVRVRALRHWIDTKEKR